MSNAWTQEERLTALMRLPWTVALERDLEDGSFVFQIREIPDAIGTGETEKAAAADLWESLRESLRVRLEFGDPIALPEGQKAPWEASPIPPQARSGERRTIMVKGEDGWTRLEVLRGSGTGTVYEPVHAG